MANRIFQSASDAEIVIFLRNQSTMLVSQYHQYIKRGGTSNFLNYINPKNSNPFISPRFSFDNLFYHKLVDYYINLFGRHKVHIFLYEEFKENNKLFAEKFCKDLNLDLDINKVPLYSKLNSKDNLNLLNCIRFFNLFQSNAIVPKHVLVDFPLIANFGKKWARKLFKTKKEDFSYSISTLSSHSIEERVENIYRESNRKLSDLISIDLQKFGYPT